MPTTIRLTSTYNGHAPNTVITVPDAIATALLAGGVNATTDLTGGVAPKTEQAARAPVQTAHLAAQYGSAGAPVGFTTSDGRTASVFKRSLRGLAKWFGAGQGTGSATFNQTASLFNMANYGGGLKMEAEAPFTAVRLWWISRAPNAMTGSRSLVGVSETADISVAAQAFHPRINGQTYNTVVAHPATLGWRAVTWGGQATVDHPAANTAAQVKVSDWIPLSSVPRADGGTRPIFLMRNQHDGAAGGEFLTYSNGPITALQSPNAAARGRIRQLFTGGAMVTNVAAVNGLAGSVTFEVFPEFRYSVPSLSVCGVGDSITQGEGLALTGIITTWGMRACAEVSTPSRPVDWANCGAAGKQFPEFWARFLELFAAGYKPDVLFVTALSVNDYNADANNLTGFVEVGKSRVQQVFEFAQDNGIRQVIFVPCMPYNSLTAAQDVQRRAYNDWLRDFAAATGTLYMDLSALGNGAIPAKWVPAYNYAADGIHPNELAIETVMTPAAVALLRTIG